MRRAKSEEHKSHIMWIARNGIQPQPFLSHPKAQQIGRKNIRIIFASTCRHQTSTLISVQTNLHLSLYLTQKSELNPSILKERTGAQALSIHGGKVAHTLGGAGPGWSRVGGRRGARTQQARSRWETSKEACDKLRRHWQAWIAPWPATLEETNKTQESLLVCRGKRTKQRNVIGNEKIQIKQQKNLKNTRGDKQPHILICEKSRERCSHVKTGEEKEGARRVLDWKWKRFGSRQAMSHGGSKRKEARISKKILVYGFWMCGSDPVAQIIQKAEVRCRTDLKAQSNGP